MLRIGILLLIFIGMSIGNAFNIFNITSLHLKQTTNSMPTTPISSIPKPPPMRQHNITSSSLRKQLLVSTGTRLSSPKSRLMIASDPSQLKSIGINAMLLHSDQGMKPRGLKSKSNAQICIGIFYPLLHLMIAGPVSLMNNNGNSFKRWGYGIFQTILLPSASVIITIETTGAAFASIAAVPLIGGLFHYTMQHFKLYGE